MTHGCPRPAHRSPTRGRREDACDHVRTHVRLRAAKALALEDALASQTHQRTEPGGRKTDGEAPDQGEVEHALGSEVEESDEQDWPEEGRVENWVLKAPLDHPRLPAAITAGLFSQLRPPRCPRLRLVNHGRDGVLNHGRDLVEALGLREDAWHLGDLNGPPLS